MGGDCDAAIVSRLRVGNAVKNTITKGIRRTRVRTSSEVETIVVIFVIVELLLAIDLWGDVRG